MKKSEVSGFFPVLINLQTFPCLVIGGGKVAYRKTTTLQNFNANITVLSPRICKPLKELAKKSKIKIIQKSYKKEYLKGFQIIFCATDNQKVNQAVYKDCKEENKLINVADVPDLCDFILPAIVKRGDLTISVSSQGTAPFYASSIKNKLNHIFPTYYEDIADLAGEYRSKILSNKRFQSPKQKEKAFNKFFVTNWKNILANEGKKKAKERIQDVVKEFK